MDRLQPFGQRRESRSVEGRSACGAHSPRRERPAKFAGAPLRKPIAEDDHANGRKPCRSRLSRRASRRLRRDNNRRCRPYRQGDERLRSGPWFDLPCAEEGRAFPLEGRRKGLGRVDDTAWEAGRSGDPSHKPRGEEPRASRQFRRLGRRSRNSPRNQGTALGDSRQIVESSKGKGPSAFRLARPD